MILSSLAKRILTAIVLIPLVLFVILLQPPIGLAIFAYALLCFAIFEWTFIIGLTQVIGRITYLLLLSCLMFISYQFLKSSSVDYLILITAIIWWAFALIWIFYYAKNPSLTKNNQWLLALIGILILIPSFYGLCLIRLQEHGAALVIYLFVLIWFADSGAYFAGRLWGKKKLIPTVSPGKTWIGLFGGIIIGLVCASVAGFLFDLDAFHFTLWLLWSLLTILISVEGDLFISVMKRKSHLKDTGSILPGHGGVLDRLDSLTSAVPFFAFGLKFFGLN